MNAKTETPVVAAPQGQAVTPHRPGKKCMMTRRRFLLTSGLATATVMVTMAAGPPSPTRFPAWSRAIRASWWPI